MKKPKDSSWKQIEPSPLSLVDEIAFELILRAGPFCKKKADNRPAVVTYPRILEDL
jgi:hypothetical protein